MLNVFGILRRPLTQLHKHIEIRLQCLRVQTSADNNRTVSMDLHKRLATPASADPRRMNYVLSSPGMLFQNASVVYSGLSVRMYRWRRYYIVVPTFQCVRRD